MNIPHSSLPWPADPPQAPDDIDSLRYEARRCPCEAVSLMPEVGYSKRNEVWLLLCPNQRCGRAVQIDHTHPRRCLVEWNQEIKEMECPAHDFFRVESSRDGKCCHCGCVEINAFEAIPDTL